MELERVIERLEKYQEWRRDQNVPPKTEMQSPIEIGAAIDYAISELKKLRLADVSNSLPKDTDECGNDKDINLKLVKVGTVRKYMDAHFRDEISYSEAVNRINEQANKNMKAKLIFDLPDYQEEFEMAVNGHKWRNVAFMMFNFLRKNTKYASDGTHEEYVKAMYECKDELFRIIAENGLNLEL